VAKCLSFHAAYRCRRSGACCSAGWNIPFDAEERRTVANLQLTGRIVENPNGGLAEQTHGRCSFLGTDTGGAHVCEIHQAAGHASLPLTCRMFPRLVLHDSRGTFISLSHFCPTAAAMLFEAEGEIAIVDAGESLAGSEPLDGLDARDVWPPLLRPGVMMDLDSYDFWERCAIAMLTLEDVAPRRAVDALHTATARVAQWDPAGHTRLDATVEDAFAEAVMPSGVLRPFDPAVKRWLAARLFGTWISYQGNGLMTIVRYLRTCLDIFDVELARDHKPLEAIRRADHSIVHEASSQQLANLLNVRP